MGEECSDGVNTMPRTRSLYSVLQYVPDGGRAEAAELLDLIEVKGREIADALATLRRMGAPTGGASNG
jgi:hypothetical protein